MYINGAVREAKRNIVTKKRLLAIFNSLYDEWGTGSKTEVLPEESSLAFALQELVRYQKDKPLKPYSQDDLSRWLEVTYENIDLSISVGD